MKKMEKIQLQQQNPQEKTIDQFHQQVPMFLSSILILIWALVNFTWNEPVILTSSILLLSNY